MNWSRKVGEKRQKMFHCATATGGGTGHSSKDIFRGQQNVRLLGANLMLFLFLLFASEILIQILTMMIGLLFKHLLIVAFIQHSQDFSRFQSCLHLFIYFNDKSCFKWHVKKTAAQRTKVGKLTLLGWLLQVFASKQLPSEGHFHHLSMFSVCVCKIDEVQQLLGYLEVQMFFRSTWKTRK